MNEKFAQEKKKKKTNTCQFSTRTRSDNCFLFLNRRTNLFLFKTTIKKKKNFANWFSTLYTAFFSHQISNCRAICSELFMHCVPRQSRKILHKIQVLSHQAMAVSVSACWIIILQPTPQNNSSTTATLLIKSLSRFSHLSSLLPPVTYR